MSELLFTCFTSKWQTELDQNESHLGAGFCPSFRRIQCKPVENPTVGFIETHVDREFQNHQTYKCESILSDDLHLEFERATT